MLQRRLVGSQLIQLMLGEVAALQVQSGLSLPRHGRQFTREQFDQGGLAGTVGSQQADPVTGCQDQFDAVQYRPFAVSGRDLLQAQQRMWQMFRWRKPKMAYDELDREVSEGK